MRTRGQMSTRLTRAVLSAMCLVAVSASAAPRRQAPDIALKTADGREVRIADLKGRVVLVDFWASWCAPCKASFPALDALYREYRERGLEVLAVNLDERRRDADAFLADRPHALTVLFDPKGASAEAFGVQGMPSSFVIDRAGAIRFTHMGYSASVVARYREELAELLSEPPLP
jgi:thiol-disulfide isomerase/thioredoxin